MFALTTVPAPWCYTKCCVWCRPGRNGRDIVRGASIQESQCVQRLRQEEGATGWGSAGSTACCSWPALTACPGAPGEPQQEGRRWVDQLQVQRCVHGNTACAAMSTPHQSRVMQTKKGVRTVTKPIGMLTSHLGGENAANVQASSSASTGHSWRACSGATAGLGSRPRPCVATPQQPRRARSAAPRRRRKATMRRAATTTAWTHPLGQGCRPSTAAGSALGPTMPMAMARPSPRPLRPHHAAPPDDPGPPQKCR